MCLSINWSECESRCNCETREPCDDFFGKGLAPASTGSRPSAIAAVAHSGALNPKRRAGRWLDCGNWVEWLLRLVVICMLKILWHMPLVTSGLAHVGAAIGLRPNHRHLALTPYLVLVAHAHYS